MVRGNTEDWKDSLNILQQVDLVPNNQTIIFTNHQGTKLRTSFLLLTLNLSVSGPGTEHLLAAAFCRAWRREAESPLGRLSENSLLPVLLVEIITVFEGGI